MNENYFSAHIPYDNTLYKERRKRLADSLIGNHLYNSHGFFICFSGLEVGTSVFQADSTFFYLTGINEPGLVLLLTQEGLATLYMPCYQSARSLWIKDAIECTDEFAKTMYFDSVRFLGAPLSGYSLGYNVVPEVYSALMATIAGYISKKAVLYMYLAAHNAYWQYHFCNFLRLYGGIGQESIVNVERAIVAMRSVKDMSEIDRINQAIDITSKAHQAAASCVGDATAEDQIKAALEYVIVAEGGQLAFPSIVGGGSNSTVLHYQDANASLSRGDLVVVDIGARYQRYCADITRTYPVGGIFSSRQKELYQIVLDTQMHVAEYAKPGVFLNNPKAPDNSLHHIALQFLKKCGGYDQYFFHGIGHHLGIDVHDASLPQEPLTENSVITIEPGIYIKQERIGIRIEDNYWIVRNGAICLSDLLPKDIAGVQEMAAQHDRYMHDERVN